MLAKGDVLPEGVSASDQTGEERRLDDLLQKGPVVVFFYPAALTLGCTREACHFRDLAGEFAAVGAQPVGVSADQVDKQKAFDDKHSLGMPLLSDPDRRIAAAFGVGKSLFGANKRVTFVVDSDRTVLARIASEVNMGKHADEALSLLQSRAQRSA